MRRVAWDRVAPALPFVAAAVLVFLLPPLGHGGLLEPEDTSIALAARAGASAGAPLARLGAWLVARSFALFGVHAWSARLPFALAVAVAAWLTAAAVTRVVDRRAGAYAAIAFVTTPLALDQARSLGGGALGLLACAAVLFGAAGLLTSARLWVRASLAVFACAALAGLVAYTVAAHGAHPPWPSRFDVYAAHIAASLAPWSFFLPAALLRVARPPRDADEARARAESRFRALAVVFLALAVALPTWLAEDAAIFAGAPVVIALLAVALRDLDRDKVGAWELLTTAAVALVVAHDLLGDRSALLAGHGLAALTFPPALLPRAERFGGVALALFLAPLAWGYLRETWRDQAGVVAPSRGLFALLVRWAPRGRAANLGAALAAAAFVGAIVLGLGLRTAVASELSPAGAFEAYASLHRAGEPLGVVGGGSSSAELYGPPEARFAGASEAAVWLTSAPASSRRFLVVAPADLPAVSHLVRAKTGENAVVVGPPSSTALLLASSSKAGEPHTSPLDAVVRSAPPSLAHPLDARLGDTLDVLGYEVVDAAGHRLDVLHTGAKQRLRVVYRVTGPVAPGFTAFVHLDGHGRRHNGDHPLVAAGELRYPPELWLPGDIVVDESDLTLERNFAHGSYTLYLGFFAGERRLPVTRGPSDGEDRLRAGQLRVE